jgi:hypothetical protein
MSSDENHQPNASAAAPAGGQAHMASVKLPMFWANSPSAWFRSVEAQFMVKNVTSELDKCYLVLAALREVQVDSDKAHRCEEPCAWPAEN